MNNSKKNTFSIKEAKQRTILTKYEDPDVKAIFATHFAQGIFQGLLKDAKNIKIWDDAYIYLKNKKSLPYIIEREYPNGDIQYIDVN